jgi:hypothetical protein
MTRPPVRPALVFVLLAWLNAGANTNVSGRFTGRVVDATNRTPIADAIVTIASREIRPDSQGVFAVDGSEADVVQARAVGYERASLPLRAFEQPGAAFALKPFRPKALYLSVYGIGDRTLRTAALELLNKTELNALVIDLKGDRGLIPYRSAIALTTEVGAQRVITIPDLPVLMKTLRDRGVYTVARIVLFKDDLLASGRPALALRRPGGAIFRDREGLAWTNPYSREVWAYNIDIAVEAAKAGFDEIQFDYARFPDASGLAYERPWTEENRTAAIDGFFSAARKALTPYNVFLAADIFGYVCWNANDTKIGQNLEHLTAIVDYVSPMLYPSGFQFGIPGYRNPIEHPYQIVHLSLERARERTHASPLHFRPWLQAFRDYAFGGRPFTAGEVRSQIDAVEGFGGAGWMLWNSHNRYSATDLRP